MQITNHAAGNLSATNEVPFETKNGEIYSAHIKERISDKEAVLQIRGKEFTAQFEDKVPSGDKATVQVTEQNNQKITVKEIKSEVPTSANPRSPDISQLLQKIGLTGKEGPEIKEAVKLLLEKGSPLSKEVVNELKSFFEKAEGTIETKNNTLRALVNKGLEVTQTHLRSIHEALHGKPFSEVLVNIAKELNPNFSTNRLQVPSVSSEKQIVEVKSSQVPTPSQNSIGHQLMKQDVLKELIGSIRNVVESEPDLQKALVKVKETVLNDTKVDRNVANQIVKVVSDAEKLHSIGKERIVQALKNAENQITAKAQIITPVEAVKVDLTVRQQLQDVKSLVSTLRNEVVTNPNLKSSIEQVKAQLIKSNSLPTEASGKLEKALNEVTRLMQQGRMTTGKEVLGAALGDLNRELSAKPKGTANQGNSEVIKQVKEAVQQEPRLQKAVEQVRDQIVNNPKIDREVAQKVEKAVQEATQLQQMGREGAGKERLVQALAKAEVEMSQVENRRVEGSPRQAAEPRISEVVKQVKEAVQQEPRLQKAVEQVRNQIVNNPKIDREVAQKVERAVQEAAQLQQMGREGAGKERLVQAIANAEVEMAQVENRRVEAQSRQAMESRQTEPSINTRQMNEPKPADLKIAPSQQPITKQETKDTIRQVREQIQTEPDLKKVMAKVQDQIVNNKNVDSEVSRAVEKAVNQANQLDEAGRERLVKLLQQLEAPSKQTVNSTEKNISTQQNNNQQGIQMPKLPSETVQQALKQFQSEADVDKGIELVRKEVSANPNIDLKNVSKINQALENAEQLSEKGREIAARQQVTKELTEIQQSLAKTEPKVEADQSANSQYDVTELLQSMQIQSKDILVTKVTQKLAEATHEFRELKREITRNLDSVQRTIDMFKSNAHPQASKMLETAISKLDNAILKSDMMLFTDMKTEKQLLQASSQLAEAKKLLAKGDFTQASKIVGKVKELIDKINFKPSDQKVMHFVGKESLMMENRNAALEAGARGMTMPEPSARQMFELVRNLGLNHDSETANSLVFKNNDQQHQEQQQNMKAVLMKLQQDESNPRVAQQAEQALNNLTGQQLLSKADSSGTMQSMLFNLPMLLGGKPEYLQVFVNSKTEGQQVDWENCNLYFLIETKRLGDVGIMLASTERNLSITIKNDKPGFKEKMEPLATMAKAKLNEIGYNVNSLHFTRMTPVDSQNRSNQTIDQKPKKPIFTEKGMDFKI